MASLPSASAAERAAASIDLRLWWSALAAGFVLCVAYAAIPTEHTTLRNLVVYPLGELGAIAAIVVGVRRYRPAAPWAWLLIAAGLCAWLIGDVLWGVYEVRGRDPFPSPADAFYLAGYPLIAAGLLAAMARRAPTSDKRALLDAGIITVSASLVTWVYLIEPALDDPGLTTFEALVSAAYPLGDLVLLAGAARFVMGTSWNTVSLRLLVLGLALTLVGDTLYAFDVLERIAEDTRLADVLLLVAVVSIGLAGLHRSMPALTEQADAPVVRIDTLRLVLLGGLCMLPPVVLLVQAIRGESLYLGATIVAMVLLTGLVIARFTDITTRARSAANREETLSGYAAELLRANGRDELLAVARRTAPELLRGGKVSLLAPPTDDTHGFTVPVEVRGERVAELVADGKPAKLNQVRDSLTTVAAQLALALERDRLLATERETAEKLAEQNERLRELDEMKDQFVSSTSHELRTPLTAMVGYLELLLEGDAGELGDQQRHFLEIVNRNSLRLNKLVDDILFVSRADSGRLSFDRQPVDLADLAGRSVESVRAAADKKGLHLELSVEQDLPPFDADPTRLTEMFDNLLSNAIKFTAEGGTVSVTVAKRGEAAHVEVGDTGVGIPKDEVGRVFERFFRASTTTTLPGTGLGLPIVKTIVEAHGGDISLESIEGVGTTFRIELPLQPPTESDAAAPEAPTEVAT